MSCTRKANLIKDTHTHTLMYKAPEIHSCQRANLNSEPIVFYERESIIRAIVPIVNTAVRSLSGRITCNIFKCVWCQVSTWGQNTMNMVLQEFLCYYFLPEAKQVSTHYLNSRKQERITYLNKHTYKTLVEHLANINWVFVSCLVQEENDSWNRSVSG